MSIKSKESRLNLDSRSYCDKEILPNDIKHIADARRWFARFVGDSYKVPIDDKEIVFLYEKISVR